MALAKQDHMDQVHATASMQTCSAATAASITRINPTLTLLQLRLDGTLALSKLGVAPMCRTVIINHLTDTLASPQPLPDVCRKALAEVVRVLSSALDDAAMCHHLNAVLVQARPPPPPRFSSRQPPPPTPLSPMATARGRHPPT